MYETMLDEGTVVLVKGKYGNDVIDIPFTCLEA